MKFGFVPTEGGGRTGDAISEAVAAEELGFDSVWLEEHHSVPDHYWPSPIILMAAIAARTERIRLGTDVIVLPFYHPVRLAEDVAVLEGISNDRFVLGAAIGYREVEFRLHGVSLEGRGSRLEEALGIMRALWRGDAIDHEGRWYTVAGRIEPVPARTPEVWIGGWGPRTIERAARLGDAWIPGPTADLPRLVSLRATYDEALIAVGRNPADVPRPLTRDVVIAPTDQEAWELAERHLLVAYRDEYGGGWAHPLVGSADKAPIDRIDALAADRFVIGSPETCRRQIGRLAGAFGADELICRLSFPGLPHDVLLAELRLLAEDVIPAFRSPEVREP